ncbi:MAG: hypothetical protein JST00_44515 [Deltaproteobacteria bacterium]|nr:hypothetical protein [Deltaproteobacteria bacterium]
MKPLQRIAVATTASAVFLAASAGVARAQSVPPAGPPPAGAAPAAAPPPSAADPVQPTPGTVRLHFHTFREKGTARIYSRQADGRYGFVCATPCTADIPAHTPLRVTYNDREDDPKDFDAGPRVGEELAVEVKAPSAGPVIGGAILMGVGGASILSGVILVALAEDLRDNIISASGYRSVGFVTIGIGAALAIAGIVWFTGRSHEPRIEAYPSRGGDDRYDDRERDRRRRRSRAETFLEDQALAKPVDPLAPIAPAAAPVGWSFAF